MSESIKNTLIKKVSDRLTSFEQISTIDKEVETSSLWELNSLPDNIVELVSRKIDWDKVPKIKGSDFHQKTYLVLSISGSFEVSDFSQITGILSGYLSLILSDSAFLFSTRKY